jgi:hypothetical protein
MSISEASYRTKHSKKLPLKEKNTAKTFYFLDTARLINYTRNIKNYDI